MKHEVSLWKVITGSIKTESRRCVWGGMQLAYKDHVRAAWALRQQAVSCLGNGALEEVVGEIYRVQILGPQNSPVSWVCSCHLTEVLKMPASLTVKPQMAWSLLFLSNAYEPLLKRVTNSNMMHPLLKRMPENLQLLCETGSKWH